MTVNFVQAVLVAPSHEQARCVIERWRDTRPELAAGRVITPQSIQAVKDGYRVTVVYLTANLGADTPASRIALRRVLAIAERALLKTGAEPFFRLLPEDPDQPVTKERTRDVIERLAPLEPEE